MEALLPFFDKYLDRVLFAIIILSGIYITQFAKEIFPRTGDRYKVLILATVSAIALFFIEGGGRLTLPRYVFTYFASTSVYEIIGHWLIRQIKKRFGEKDEDSEKIPKFDKQATGGELPPSKPPTRPENP